MTRVGQGIDSGDYQDVVYVFPLQKRIKGEGLAYYEGIFFYVDMVAIPTQTDLSGLEKIADSFFRF